MVSTDKPLVPHNHKKNAEIGGNVELQFFHLHFGNHNGRTNLIHTESHGTKWGKN
jgi:hypothetical protein